MLAGLLIEEEPASISYGSDHHNTVLGQDVPGDLVLLLLAH